jgi:hypothetical protein
LQARKRPCHEGCDYHTWKRDDARRQFWRVVSRGRPVRHPNPERQTIGEGTKRSAGVGVSASPSAIKPSLETFIIVDWTSNRRGITNPYTLIFTLREDDGVISPDDAKKIWHEILQNTLRGEDLKKLGSGD